MTINLIFGYRYVTLKIKRKSKNKAKNEILPSLVEGEESETDLPNEKAKRVRNYQEALLIVKKVLRYFYLRF